MANSNRNRCSTHTQILKKVDELTAPIVSQLLKHAKYGNPHGGRRFQKGKMSTSSTKLQRNTIFEFPQEKPPPAKLSF